MKVVGQVSNAFSLFSLLQVEITSILKFFIIKELRAIDNTETKHISRLNLCAKREEFPFHPLAEWSKGNFTNKRRFLEIKYAGRERKKLSARKNDFNLMFNGFLFRFLIRQNAPFFPSLLWNFHVFSVRINYNFLYFLSVSFSCCVYTPSERKTLANVLASWSREELRQRER